MDARRQTNLERVPVLLTAAAVLLLLGPCAATDDLQISAAPAPSPSALTTRNSSLGEPRVLRSHRSCKAEHPDFCHNGGECFYPQDSDKPSCRCPSSYSDQRCMFLVYEVQTLSTLEVEQVVAISFGAVMLIVGLAVSIYCLVNKRCKKFAQPVKAGKLCDDLV